MQGKDGENAKILREKRFWTIYKRLINDTLFMASPGACPCRGFFILRRRVKTLQGRPKQKVKRVLDLLICLLGLPLLLPLGALLALVVWLDSHACPIYTQKRIGKNGRTFKIYKFRTMVKDADELLARYLADNPAYAAEWRGVRKLRKDPRITRTGAILRKISLDELPQIFNILIGDMTLVGPRPIVDEEKQKYGRFFREYCSVSPGLTGLWQITGRNNTTYERRVACDRYYMNNWSLRLDMWILWHTIPAAITGHGAY